MMYWSFPEVSERERLSKAENLAAGAIRISPEIAYATLQSSEPLDGVRIDTLDGRPVYRFRGGLQESLVYADNGDRLTSVGQEVALRIAARWTGEPATGAHFDGLLRDVDQWTVSGELAASRPFFKFSWRSGQQVYVSARSGEVVQHTSQSSRIAAYLGAIPHWFYWTPLRRNGGWWYRVVVWLSAAATGIVLLGLMIGCWMYSPNRRYRFQGHPTRIPYSGAKRWHMVLGLVFGTLACTWSFSGLLSMEPFNWLNGNREGALAVAAALRGDSIPLEAFTSKWPGAALGQAGLLAKEIEMAFVGGQPYYIVRQSPKVSRIVPVQGDPLEQFPAERILEIVRQASEPTTVAEARVINSYEAYYLDRNGQLPLPALAIRLNDATRREYYVDLKTANVVASYDGRSRWNRWLYHGLHSWDIPWLYAHRPAWDLWVVAMLTGGIALTLTAVILGFGVLRRLQ